MKQYFRLFTLSALCFIVSSMVANAHGQAVAEGSWTLDNGVIRKTVAFSASHGLEVQEWSDLTTAYNFISPQFAHHSCNEFQVQVDGRTISGASAAVTLTGSRQDQLPDGTKRLELTLSARHVPLKITVLYELGAGQPAIRQSLAITNTGQTPVTLKHLTVSCGMLPPGPERDLIAFGGYGEQPRETYFTGRVDDVAVMLENAKTGVGWAVLSEVPGYMKRTELGQLGQWSPSFAAMYDTDLFPFERTLLPRETFTSAGVSVLFYKRNTAADPHWRIPSYVRDRIAHAKKETPPLWIYNTWEPWRGKLGSSELGEIITKAAADGFNLLTIDDGWEAKLGENSIRKENFPDGLGPVFAQMDSLGMKHGLWSSVALISTSAEAYVQHPDWACRDREGHPRLSQGQGVVMCLASPYKYAVTERLSDLVRRYRLSYIKLDLTSVFNTYGEEPGCFEPGHEHKTAHESSERIYEALDFIANTLHQRFPHLLIDYTFELWGQKHLIDYGLLKVADLDWLSNVRDQSDQEAGPLQVRTLLYQRAMAIPVDSLLIGNLQAEQGSWQEHVATEMGSGAVFLGDLRRQNSADSRHFKEWIERYNLLRSRVSISDSFFPLGAWRQPRVDQWDGFARLARNGEGLLVLFRNESRAPSAEIAIPGYPNGDFTLRSWDGSKDVVVDGGRIRDKLAIPFSEGQTVKVIEIHRTRQKATRSNAHEILFTAGQIR